VRARKSIENAHGGDSGRASAHALTPEIEAELRDIAEATGCELLHAEWKGGILRLILDRAEGEAPAAPAHAAPSAWTAPPLASIASPFPIATAAIAAGAQEVDPPAPPADLALDAAAGAAGAPSQQGVSLGDCELVAKLAGAFLDVLDFGNGRYTLEVSSPGLDRQLYSARDYQRFVGRLAKVTFELPGSPAAAAAAASGAGSRAVQAVRPARRTVVARLAEFRRPAGAAAAGTADTAQLGEVTLLDERTGERLTLPLSSIRQARLEVEL
jgi:ribosome maturation factor RimP